MSNINTKESRKEAIEKRKQYTLNYQDRFEALFHNSITVENEGDLPKRYLLRELLRKGGIAYDKETGLYLPFVQSGIDVYGLPKEYHLIGYNGLMLVRKVDGVVILRANDLQFAISTYLDLQIGKLVDIDMAIEQNLEATKTMSIMVVNDQKTLLTLANLGESRRIGATLAFVNKSSIQGDEISVQSTGAQYLVDKLLEARKEILNETLATLGMNVANTEKRERVQGMEIEASNGYAVDCITTLIDTFNYDAEYGGLPIRLKANTSLMEDRLKLTEEEKDGNGQQDTE